MEITHYCGASRFDPALCAPLARALAQEPELFDRLAALRRAVLAAPGSWQRRLRLGPALGPRAALLSAAPGGALAGPTPDEEELPRLAAALAHLERYRPVFAAMRVRSGVKRGAFDPRTAALLAEVLAAYGPLARPAAVIGVGNGAYDPAGVTVGTLRIASRDVARRVGRAADPAGRARIALFVATIGPDLDAAAAALARREPTRALLLNAFGAAAAELGGEDVAARVANALPGPGRLRRYHVGYGDWPLAAQRDLVDALGAGPRLGVTVTTAGVLVPEKSVSGLVTRPPS